MIRLLTAALLFASFNVVAEVTLTPLNNNTPADADDVMGNFNALNDALPPSDCTTDQIIKWDGSDWVCATDPFAGLNCNVGDRLVFGNSGWKCVNEYSISGNLTGLQSGNSVVLTLNGGDFLTVSGNGLFTFPTEVEIGESYAVQVQTQPVRGTQKCTVANGSGTVVAPVTDVVVTCNDDPFAFASTTDYSVGISTTVHAIFETRSTNLANTYCSPTANCEFKLSNVVDHTACTLTATNDSGVPYEIFITYAPGYILINDAGSVFTNQAVNVEIVCPGQ